MDKRYLCCWFVYCVYSLNNIYFTSKLLQLLFLADFWSYEEMKKWQREQTDQVEFYVHSFLASLESNVTAVNDRAANLSATFQTYTVFDSQKIIWNTVRYLKFKPVAPV